MKIRSSLDSGVWPRRTRGTSARPLLLGLLLLSAGCSGDDGLNCESLEFANCDIRVERCQQQVFDSMRCLRDDHLEARRPSVEMMSEAQVRMLFEEAAEEVEVGEDDVHAHNVLALLGLVEPGTAEVGGHVGVSLEGLLGFYSAAANAVVVLESDETDFSGIRAVTTLGHEFVHALQHADFDMAAYRDSVPGTFDAALASTSVLEGEATLYERFLQAELEGLPRAQADWRSHFEELTGMADEYAAEHPPPAPLAFSLFPYTYGGYSSFWAWKGHGAPGIAALRDVTFPNTLTDLGNRHDYEAAGAKIVPVPATGRPVGFTDAGHDSLGAWLLHGFSVQVLKEGAHPQRALGWRGDRLNVFGSKDDGSAAIWSVRWATEELASEFVTVVRKLKAPPTGGVWGARRDGLVSHLYVASTDAARLKLVEQATFLGVADQSPPHPGGSADAGSTEPLASRAFGERSSLRSLVQRGKASCFLP